MNGVMWFRFQASRQLGAFFTSMIDTKMIFKILRTQSWAIILKYMTKTHHFYIAEKLIIDSIIIYQCSLKKMNAKKIIIIAERGITQNYNLSFFAGAARSFIFFYFNLIIFLFWLLFTQVENTFIRHYDGDSCWSVLK